MLMDVIFNLALTILTKKGATTRKRRMGENDFTLDLFLSSQEALDAILKVLDLYFLPNLATNYAILDWTMSLELLDEEVTKLLKL